MEKTISMEPSLAEDHRLSAPASPTQDAAVFPAVDDTAVTTNLSLCATPERGPEDEEDAAMEAAAEDAVSPAAPASEGTATENEPDLPAEDDTGAVPLGTAGTDAADAVDVDVVDGADTADDQFEETRLDEHDSLVTVRLSEPPILTVVTDTTTRMPDAEQEDEETGTPTAGRRTTMSAGSSGSGSGDNPSEEESDDEEVDWDQLQRNEDAESNNDGTDNTAMLLARLEQENAKLATNPKSVRVQSPETVPQPRSSRRVRPPSMAQLRDMVHGPTPSALRYSRIPPPPLTDLEFYAALVQDYHQTAARLPTLLSNKIHKGIPPPLRGVVWQGITGATRDTALAEQYERFCDATSPYEGIIGKDLGRSFPGVDMFREPDGDGQRMLGSVLRSYSLHEPRIGYCQGLAFLVGPLLMHMPDKEAFCVLVKLMENYDLRSSYMPDLAGLHVRIFQFRELLRVALPDLSSHLDALQVDPAAYVSQWFLSFFAVTCPLPMLFRMYDVIFAEGAAETIMRVALSLMQKNQARLLACAELEDAMQLLLSRGLWDCYHYNANEFVLHFLGQSHIVTRDRLALLEQAYRGAQIGKINQTDGANVDRSSTIATVASRFLGRLWTTTAQAPPPPSSSSPSTSLSTAAASASTASTASSTSPSSHEKSAAQSSSLTSPPRTSSPTTGAAASSGSLSLGVGAGLSASPLRPLSMLQRSASKNSIASTVTSMEAASSAAGSSTSSSSSVLSSASTEATTVSRDSSAELNGAGSKRSAAAASQIGVTSTGNKQSDNERYLNSQIEDLLTAMTDLQRQHNLVADQLQREREERDDDRKTVQALVRVLRDKTARAATEASATPVPALVKKTLHGVQLGQTEMHHADELLAAPRRRAATSSSTSSIGSSTAAAISTDEFLPLLELIEARFGRDMDNRRSEIPQTKAQLRTELARAKEQLSNELAKEQDSSRRAYETEQEMNVVKEQLRESHGRARVLLQDKQRLERQIQTLRARVAADGGPADGVSTGSAPVATAAGAAHSGAQGVANAATEWFGRATGTSVGASANGNVGLRELKLGRSKSTPTKKTMSAMGNGVRSSSLTVRNASPGRPESISSRVSEASGDLNAEQQQQEALVLELVQAKTSEAVARQEAEEAKQKLESLRKAMGLSPSSMASLLQGTSNAGGGGSKAVSPPTATATATPATGSGYGSFFGWRR